MDRSFIFFPEKHIAATPESVGLEFEDVTLQASDGVKVNGWYVPHPESKQTLLFFHGNAGNISNRIYNLRLFHDQLGLSVFILDYRGYGKSEGEPSEEGTYRDGEAALSYLKERTGRESRDFLFFGRSLGAAVAVELALKNPPRALILESPMTSVRDMAKNLFPFLPVGFMISTEYDSLSKIGKIHVPVFVLHGDRDEVVPFEQGKRLFEAANSPKQFYTIPGAGHNNTTDVGGAPYWKAWKDFLKTHS